MDAMELLGHGQKLFRGGNADLEAPPVLAKAQFARAGRPFKAVTGLRLRFGWPILEPGRRRWKKTGAKVIEWDKDDIEALRLHEKSMCYYWCGPRPPLASGWAN